MNDICVGNDLLIGLATTEYVKTVLGQPSVIVIHTHEFPSVGYIVQKCTLTAIIPRESSAAQERDMHTYKW